MLCGAGIRTRMVRLWCTVIRRGTKVYERWQIAVRFLRRRKAPFVATMIWRKDECQDAKLRMNLIFQKIIPLAREGMRVLSMFAFDKGRFVL